MIRQNQSQRQQLKINPEQLKLLALYHLTSQQLELRIKQELEENPTLEVKDSERAEEHADTDTDYRDWDEYGYDDVPDYKIENRRYFQHTTTPARPVVSHADFRTDLKMQLAAAPLTASQREFAAFIIDNLNDRGFLETTVTALADDYAMKTMQWLEDGDVQKVLRCIHQLDPGGIGAQNTKECLLLQLERMNSKRPDVKAAKRLLTNHYDDLIARNLEKLEKELTLESDELRIVLELLSTLNLAPISGDTTDAADTILPEFKVECSDDRFEVSLTKQRSASLFLSNRMKALVTEARDRDDRHTFRYLQSKLNAAEWFVNAVKQREQTMLSVMKAITKHQRDFFLTGDRSQLKPMILKDIAATTGLDISTISRITSNKYADTPNGILLLKNLFSEGVQMDSGEVISNKVIQQKLEEVINSEDKKRPYSDQQLVSQLALNGISIARRTVTKYRDLLQIPTAQMRAFWA